MAVVPPTPEPDEPGGPAEISGPCTRRRRAEPALVDQMSPRAHNLAIQAAVVLVLAVLLLPGPWSAALLTFLVVAVPVGLALRALHRVDR